MEETKWSIDYDGEDFTIKVGQHELKGMEWKGPEQKFIYIFVHGLGVFSTMYREVFDVIMGMGGIVLACDHYGHGRSPGPRVAGTIDMIVEETAQLIMKAHEMHPGLPLVIHGHSMGGLVTLTLCIQRPDFVLPNVNAVILEAPWLSESPQRRFNCCLRCLLRSLNLVLKHVLVNTECNPYTEYDDPKWAELMKGCKEAREQITPELMVSALDAQQFVFDNCNLFPKDLPMLFMQSNNDTMVDPENQKAWFTKLTKDREYPNARAIIYKEGSHTTPKTAIREKFYNDMKEFIIPHI